MPLLTDRYAAQIAGVVSCYDRLAIMGTLPGIALHYPDRPITAALREAAAALVGRDGGGSP